MAILIIKTGRYKNNTACENLLRYIFNPDKAPNKFFGGTGVPLSNPILSMLKVKDAYCHDTGKHMEHFILLFAFLIVIHFYFEIVRKYRQKEYAYRRLSDDILNSCTILTNAISDQITDSSNYCSLFQFFCSSGMFRNIYLPTTIFWM